MRVQRITLIGLLVATLLVLPMLSPLPSQAQGTQPPKKLFSLPFTAPPGPTTWLLDQQHGNTVGAYNFGKYWYAGGQGLHFGVDFAAPCQTPIVAIADGEVDQVDNFSFGLQPHNLTIFHRDIHYTSVYGHLYAKPTLTKGQPVKRGDVIGYSGDPDLTCVSRPHLHMEIRSSDYHTSYNPIPLIDADWNMLSMIGYYQFGGFIKDLFHPNRWQLADDQPDVEFNQDTLNAYTASWPPYARNEPAPQTLAAFASLPLAAKPADLKQLTQPGCCSQSWWAPDSQTVRFWNGPDNQAAAIQAVSINGGAPQTIDDQNPLKIVSSDGKYEIRIHTGNVFIARLADGVVTPLATGGAWPRFSPGNKLILWHRFPADDIPGGAPPASEVWVSNLDGSNRRLIKVQQGGLAFWLDDNRILLTEPIGRSYDSKWSIYTLSSGKSETLFEKISNARAISIAPGGARITYYQPFQVAPAPSGLFMIDAQPGARPTKLPIFGSWRWRDSNSLIYVPYEPSPMKFMLYDIFSGQSKPITDPAQLKFDILNDDWNVSPDGQKIVFWRAEDTALWAVTLPH